MELEVKLNFLKQDPSIYLNKSTILYGAGNSGKTTFLIDILHTLKDQVPNIFAFAPTAECNNAYDGIIPDQFIFKEIDISIMNKIYTRQQAAAKIYIKVNDINLLKSMVHKIGDTKVIADIHTINTLTETIIAKEKAAEYPDYSKIQNIIRLQNEAIKHVYKSSIATHLQYLSTLQLTEDEQYVVKYLHFNPNCIIIMDDCGAELKKFQKEEVMRKIFFQGRHSHITIIWTLQDDLNLDSALKKNAYINIFTTARCAATYFERANNAFSKKEKLYAVQMINQIFSSTDKKVKNYKKLVFIRDDIDPYRYAIATIHAPFRFGCSKLWKICDAMEKRKKKCNFNNDPMLSKFKINKLF